MLNVLVKTDSFRISVFFFLTRPQSYFNTKSVVVSRAYSNNEICHFWFSRIFLSAAASDRLLAEIFGKFARLIDKSEVNH